MAHVLIVDDNTSTRRMLAELMELEGHTATEAGDGLIGLMVLSSTLHPLVVIMSHLMPVMTGAEAMALVADDPELAAFHEYIFVTACPYECCFALVNVLLPHPAPYVQRPFQPDTLVGAVHEAARRIEARQEKEHVVIVESASAASLPDTPRTPDAADTASTPHATAGKRKSAGTPGKARGTSRTTKKTKKGRSSRGTRSGGG